MNSYPTVPPVCENILAHTDADLAYVQREILSTINHKIHEEWCLGRHVMLNWCDAPDGIEVLSVPYFLAPSILSKNYLINTGSETRLTSGMDLFRGGRYQKREALTQLALAMDIKPVSISLPYNLLEQGVDTKLVDEIIKRYSISCVENSAVALFDIVGFSLYNAFEQVTLLNSLAYSINSAHNKMVENGLSVEFARSTTGDGFYIWNRDNSIQGNINLYHLMHIVLADNAIARTHSHGDTAPILKTAFHIGQYYEYYQAESLQPTQYNYIVGDVTVELARMVERAMPGQILVGKFSSKLPRENDNAELMMDVDTVRFIELLQNTLASVKGLVISGQEIDAINCYLTGIKHSNRFDVSRYEVKDKHNLSRKVYNAKVNIYRENQPPIYLGLQDHAIKKFGLNRLTDESSEPLHNAI